MNILGIALAFVEGLGLILTPCILPILPIILAASVDGGKRRPFGIITGFILGLLPALLCCRGRFWAGRTPTLKSSAM
jgi:cytochrome c biogenesis protein CcdA